MAYIVPIKSQTDMNIVASVLHSAGYKLYSNMQPRIGGRVRIWCNLKLANLNTGISNTRVDIVCEPSDLYHNLATYQRG